MIDRGVQGISIEEEMADSQKEDSGFLKLIEGFMGLGLIVGLAAVGVIAFRSVVERRQHRSVRWRLVARSLISLSLAWRPSWSASASWQAPFSESCWATTFSTAKTWEPVAAVASSCHGS